MTDVPQWVNVEDLQSLITHDREKTGASTVEDYASRSTSPPAIVVSYDKDRGVLKIEDGNHRVAACRRRLQRAQQKSPTRKTAYMKVNTPFRYISWVDHGGCKLPEHEEDRKKVAATTRYKRIFPTDVGMNVIRRRETDDDDDEDSLWDTDGELRAANDRNVVWC